MNLKWIEKLKAYITHHNHKKMIYHLIVLALICTIGLITFDTFFPYAYNHSNKNNVLTDKKEVAQKSDGNLNYQDTQQKQLENILQEIKGVGDVEVMITYESSAEVVPAFNVTESSQTTEEKDAQGGSRTTTQNDLQQDMVRNNGNEQLVIIKEIKPKIRGVVVVAQGASNVQIKDSVIKAVQTVFQIPSHKVMVYEKNNG